MGGKEDELTAHDRSLVTISALIAMGNTEQLVAHLQIGKNNGKRRKKLSLKLSLAFYVGCPKLGQLLIEQKKFAGKIIFSKQGDKNDN